MPSKMIIRREESAVEVEAAVKAHAHKAQAGVAHTLTPFMEEGEAFPDLETLQRLCGRALAHHHRELVLKDEAHLAELRNDGEARDRRDSALGALLELLVTIRDSFQTVFGRRASHHLLGLGGPMTRDPIVLARKGRRVLTVLQSETLQLPPPRLSGISLEITGLATSLEPPLLELEAALDDVASDRREAETTLAAKQEALQRHDRIYLRISRLIEDLYRLGDLDGLAEKIRPRGRRSRRATTLEAKPDPSAKPATEAPEVPPKPLRLVSSAP